MVEIKNLSVRFGSTVALNDVNLSFKQGEIHALVGENGAGKSTLMKVLSGAQTDFSGTITLDGNPYKPAHPAAARSAGVSMIYQELSLISHLTVEENFALELNTHKRNQKFLLSRKSIRKTAQSALEKIGHSQIQTTVPVGNLPISSRQIVEIARALATDCKVLILDEPTSSLNPSDIHSLFETLRELKKKGYLIIYISHFLEEIKAISDRVTILRDGAIVSTHETPQISTQEIVTQMLGKNLKDLYPKSKRAPGQPLLRLEKLTGVSRFSHVDLEIKRGEVLGIAGLMGSGRTEILRAIFGLDPIRSGQISFEMYSGFATPAERWQQKAGFLSEDRRNEGLSFSLNLAENLTLPSLQGLGRFGFISRRKQNDLTREWINRLAVRCQGATQKIGELSGGNQQKIAFARLLNARAELIILDEPTRGIDIAAKSLIYKMIDEQASQGRSVLIVSSYFPELLGICDRIAVLKRGSLSAAKDIGEWDEKTLALEASV